MAEYAIYVEESVTQQSVYWIEADDLDAAVDKLVNWNYEDMDVITTWNVNLERIIRADDHEGNIHYIDLPAKTP